MAKTATATVEDPRGLKRICLSCSTRFYDLNNRPIICPNCGTEYTGDLDVKGQKIVEEKAQVEDSQTEETTSEDEDDDTIVSLDDLDEDDASDDENDDPDLEALKEIGEDIDDADIDDADDIDVSLDEDDDK